MALTAQAWRDGDAMTTRRGLRRALGLVWPELSFWKRDGSDQMVVGELGGGVDGVMDQDGQIEISHEISQDLHSLAAAAERAMRLRGVVADPRAVRGWWTVLHEELHLASSLASEGFDDIAIALEEVAVEAQAEEATRRTLGVTSRQLASRRVYRAERALVVRALWAAGVDDPSLTRFTAAVRALWERHGHGGTAGAESYAFGVAAELDMTPEQAMVFWGILQDDALHEDGD